MASMIVVTNEQFLAKVETTPGTWEAPVAGGAIRLVEYSERTPEIEEIDNQSVDGSMSPGVKRRGYKKDQMVLAFELKGSGTEDTDPEWMVLLKACGYKAVSDAGVSVTITPDPDEKKSISVQSEYGGMIYKMHGCAGEASFDWIAGKCTVTLTGKYNAPVAGAATANPVYDATSPVSGARAFSWNSKTIVLRSLVFNDGAQIAERINRNDATGFETFTVTKHDPTCEQTWEECLVEKHEDAAIAGTAAEYTLALGTVAGNTLTVTGSKMQLGSPAPSKESGVQLIASTGPLVDSAAGAKDWMTIVQT